MYGSGLIGWWTIIPLTYIAIQLNTLEVGYLSICRLLNDHSAEYIASGICVHLQIINIAIHEYIASGICVHLQIIVWFRFNRLVDNHPTNLL